MELRMPAKFQKPQTKEPLLTMRYFVMSVNADRSIIGFGNIKKGVWVETPQHIYQGISNAVVADPGCGWAVKTEKR
jgi:hypothetical protein